MYLKPPINVSGEIVLPSTLFFQLGHGAFIFIPMKFDSNYLTKVSNIFSIAERKSR